MISAWKKFINKNGELPNENNVVHMPPGVHKLDKELQRKFARGVNYNMKIVIRGDNKVGKTSLFLRLKGYGFEDNYTATETLNVTSIDWSYKATDDVVKIDLWEAIDSAASRKDVNFVDLKLHNDNINGCSVQESSQESVTNSKDSFTKTKPNLARTIITRTQINSSMNGFKDLTSAMPDSAKQSLAELSETFDVYRGADAVLLMMDMTKNWTFKYIQAELPKIPKHIPVLVIANFRDQGHHRTVSAVQVRSHLEGLSSGPGDGTIMYTETSMKNGFGMRLIEKFINIPFLKLQEAALVKHLEINRQDSVSTFEELHILQESIDREYEQYLELQTIRRRQEADAMSPVNLGIRQLDESAREQIRNANFSSDILDKRASNVTSIESEDYKRSSPQIPANFVNNDRLVSIVIGAKNPLPDLKPITLSSKKSDTNEDYATKMTPNEATTGQIDETSDESDGDEKPRANPLVANYQSDVDSDDQAK